MSRDVEKQHEMVQEAIDEVRRQAAKQNNKHVVEAAIRNQEIQALTLIALELRELRGTIQDANSHTVTQRRQQEARDRVRPLGD